MVHGCVQCVIWFIKAVTKYLLSHLNELHVDAHMKLTSKFLFGTVVSISRVRTAGSKSVCCCTSWAKAVLFLSKSPTITTPGKQRDVSLSLVSLYFIIHNAVQYNNCFPYNKKATRAALCLHVGFIFFSEHLIVLVFYKKLLQLSPERIQNSLTHFLSKWRRQCDSDSPDHAQSHSGKTGIHNNLLFLYNQQTSRLVTPVNNRWDEMRSRLLWKQGL